MKNLGESIAIAALSLFVASSPSLADTGNEKSAEIKCSGINACKGKGSCASAKNDCKGQNGCKGQGWVITSAKACKDQHGTVVRDAPAKKPQR